VVVEEDRTGVEPADEDQSTEGDIKAEEVGVVIKPGE
jgi:hypothetical protein